MNDAVIRLSPDGVSCSVHTFGNPFSGGGTPLFIMPVPGESSDLIEGQHMRLGPVVAAGGAKPHLLAVFETKNWDDDLSPWPAPALRRGCPDFGGRARETLSWILDRLIPEVEVRLPVGGKGLLGYSMGGLFSLWAMYQTDVFTVCGSCSGSLWYDRFTDYLERNTLKGPCSVYLSLGEEEEHARNPIFARVGSATRRAAEIFAASPTVRETALVWHPGGHSGFTGERLAAAQLWLNRHIRTGE